MANRFWVGGTGTWNNTSTTNWAATSGGASGASAPTAADTVTFDSNSGTAATVTVAATAVSASATINKSDINLSLSGSPTLCASTGTLTLTAGTLTLNNNQLSCGTFSSSNSNARTIAFGTGNITLTGNSVQILAISTATNISYTGTPLFVSTYAGATGTRTFRLGNAAGGSSVSAVSLSISAGTDIVNVGGSFKTINFTGFSGTSTPTVSCTIYENVVLSASMTLSASTQSYTFAATSGTQQITTNGKTLDFPLTFNGVGGTFAFQDALTQGSTRAFTVINGTVQLKAGATSTVGSFVTSGTNQKYLQSTTAGSQATLSQASGTVSVSALTIKDINAVGGAAWNAYVDFQNIDAGNVDGWNFSLSPPYAGFEPPITLRSFTQPRRF